MSDALRISVADMGTNTIKVLHAVRHSDGSIERIDHVSNTIRLGFGIETAGHIEPKRLEECVEFLKDQERYGRELGSTDFIGVGTEAIRIASNGHVLTRRIAEETSWKIDVITGMEEASLTFLGLKNHLPEDVPSAIIDIGGGSTEIIVADAGTIVWQESLPIGSGRLADRYFEADPPGMEATALAFAAAHEELERLENIPVKVHTALFSGGNGVFLQSLLEQLFPGESVTIHSTERLLQHLSITPASDTAERLGIALQRARVFPAGVAIALAAISRIRATDARGVYSGIQIGLIARYAGSRNRS